ncbi:MAG: DinB family protein [Anaerolineae bacterium]|nr:DinB family protein [Anaerolineae bacterium]
MNIDYIRTIITYNYAVHQQLWDSIMHLTDEQYVQSVDYSTGSIRNHIVHLASADQRWIARVNGDPLPDRLNAEDFPDRASARQKWAEVETHVTGTVQALDDAALQKVIHYELKRANDITIQAATPVWQILAHIVNHGTDHRAQVLAILHGFEAPTFEQDLMIYLWDQQ